MTTPVLPAAHRRRDRSSARRSSTPCAPNLRGLVDHLGDVQQRLGRDAADVEADAAERRVARRPAPPSARDRRRGRRRCSRPARRRAPAGRPRNRPWRAGGGGGAAALGAPRRAAERPRRSTAGVGRQQRALAHLVADLDGTSPITPSAGAGTSIVALSLSRVISDLLFLDDALPGLDVDFDDRHVLEVADVGKPDFFAMACVIACLSAPRHSITRRMSSTAPARWRMKRAAAAPSITR